jgi:phosphopantetheine adenylyltransferase
MASFARHRDDDDEDDIPTATTICLVNARTRTRCDVEEIREEIERKIPFLARKKENASVRINFKFDGIDDENDDENDDDTNNGVDGAAVSSLYANVDVLPILHAIYDSIAADENACAKNVIPVLRDSPYWDGERREARGGDGSDGAGTSAKEKKGENNNRAHTKRFDNVCVGGTFDHAHAGHRLLLACAVAVARKRLDVGVTGEALLANKKYKEYLQPYAEREQFCKDFIKASAPVGLMVNFGPLDENWPIAATREDVDALVVSEETVEGGEKINEERKKRGFPELELVVVDVLLGRKKTNGGEGGEESGAGGKLSSTRLRELEAEKRRRPSFKE